MDNYFTSVKLFQRLRNWGIGACGTTRPSREDFPPLLQAFKDKFSAKLEWGTVVAAPVGGVLCMGWSDNNAVLVLSTIHTVSNDVDFVERNRRAPTGKSANAKNARKAFKGNARMLLKVPRVIDDYNHNLGAVDIADQYRSSYEVQRKALRTWFPLFYWVLDHACINAFRVGVQINSWKGSDHRKFRKELYRSLFAFSYGKREQREVTRLGVRRLNPALTHVNEKPDSTGGRGTCAWCAFRHKLDPQYNDTQAFRTNYMCIECNVYLCSRRKCFERFHQAPALWHPGYLERMEGNEETEDGKNDARDDARDVDRLADALDGVRLI